MMWSFFFLVRSREMHGVIGIVFADFTFCRAIENLKWMDEEKNGRKELKSRDSCVHPASSFCLAATSLDLSVALFRDDHVCKLTIAS